MRRTSIAAGVTARLHRGEFYGSFYIEAFVVRWSAAGLLLTDGGSSGGLFSPLLAVFWPTSGTRRRGVPWIMLHSFRMMQ
jgi:hypothetical protein